MILDLGLAVTDFLCLWGIGLAWLTRYWPGIWITAGVLAASWVLYYCAAARRRPHERWQAEQQHEAGTTGSYREPGVSGGDRPG